MIKVATFTESIGFSRKAFFSELLKAGWITRVQAKAALDSLDGTYVKTIEIEKNSDSLDKNGQLRISYVTTAERMGDYSLRSFTVGQRGKTSSHSIDI